MLNCVVNTWVGVLADRFISADGTGPIGVSQGLFVDRGVGASVAGWLVSTCLHLT